MDTGISQRETGPTNSAQDNTSRRVPLATQATTRRKIRASAQSVTILAAKVTTTLALATTAFLMQSMATTELDLVLQKENRRKVRLLDLGSTSQK